MSDLIVPPLKLKVCLLAVWAVCQITRLSPRIPRINVWARKETERKKDKKCKFYSKVNAWILILNIPIEHFKI
jgi:hypothetical protein